MLIRSQEFQFSLNLKPVLPEQRLLEKQPFKLKDALNQINLVHLYGVKPLV